MGRNKRYRALLLDRDGVINIDKHYVYRVTDCEFVPSIFKLARLAKLRGYKLIVVTNQSGIARGLFTEREYYSLRDYIHACFKQQGCSLDGEYYCPYHTEGYGSYKRFSYDRKPNPGMLLRAAEEHYLDLAHSILVGDHLSDVEAGARAGVGLRFLVNERTLSLVGRFLGWC